MDATTSVTARGNLIRQIQFPKIILPAASTVAGTITFAFGLLSLALLYLLYPRHLSPWMLTHPDHRRRAVRLHPGAGDPVLRPQHLLPRRAEPAAPRDPHLVLHVAGDLLGQRRCKGRLQRTSWASTRSPTSSPPTATWRTTAAAPDWVGLTVVLALSLVLLGVLDLGVQAGRDRLREDPLMPRSPYAVEVRDLGIRYNLNLTRRTTLKGSLAEWVGRKQQVGSHFWALRHVDFKIESRRVAGDPRAERCRQEHAAAGAGRDPGPG